MQKPTLPYDEVSRLAELRSLGLLDTPPEERFDRFTRLAQTLFDTPVAAISFVDDDRSWFKSAQGLEIEEMPREASFCAHVISSDEVLIIEDAVEDHRFADHPLVVDEPSFRFYAAYPLKGPNGHRIGALSIADSQPRGVQSLNLMALDDLGELISGEFAALALTTTDPLTGICNRRGFETLSQQAISFCARSQQPCSVLMIDLDLFKSINDEWGHAAGDKALQDLAHLLTDTFRDSDITARLGGDEFAVLLSGTAGNRAQVGVDRLTRAVDAYNANASSGWKLQFSAGIAELTSRDAASLPAAMQRADEQMYAHKRARRLRRLAS